MSRNIVIEGGISCMVMALVDEVVAEMQGTGIRFDQSQRIFVYDSVAEREADEQAGLQVVNDAEKRYGRKLQEHNRRLVEENARKSGMKIKSRKVENGKIKIILTR